MDNTAGGIDGSATQGPVAPFPDAADDGSPMTTGGLLHSAVAGRTDHLQVNTPVGAYVIPADIVSGIGEGNTLAGAKFLEDVFKDGPWNTQPLKTKKSHGPPRPPAAAAKASGGATHVPILGAGGEYVVSPQKVLALGGGDMDRGHKILDKWVVQERKRIANEMLKLPGPVKD